MDDLGTEFGIIRRTGKWWTAKQEVIRIKTMEDYHKAKHEERYKRWLERRKEMDVWRCDAGCSQMALCAGCARIAKDHVMNFMMR